MKKRMIALLAAVAILLTFTACTGGRPVKSDTTLRDFTDDCGRTVQIPQKITSVVASGALSQVILFAAAPEMLVGLASRWTEKARGIVPDKYFDLPYFGELYDSANLNVEELAMTAPQLIIDIGEAKKNITEKMDTLEAQTGIPSVHIEASLATMSDAYRRLGNLLGKEEQGEKLAQFCEKVYSRTVSVMEKVGDNKVKALYVLGESGLNVLAKGSYHAELMDLLTDNLAVVDNPSSKGIGNEVTMEQIALWDPDFVLFAPGSIYGTVGERAAWKEIRAVKSGRYAEIPGKPHNWMGNPPSVQRYLGMIWLTAVLYPQYCDYDV